MQTEMRAHWDRVYTGRAAHEVSWYQPHADRSLELIERIAAGRPSRVIDVGGGASTLVDRFVQGGGEVALLALRRRDPSTPEVIDPEM